MPTSQIFSQTTLSNSLTTSQIFSQVTLSNSLQTSQTFSEITLSNSLTTSQIFSQTTLSNSLPSSQIFSQITLSNSLPNMFHFRNNIFPNYKTLIMTFHCGTTVWYLMKVLLQWKHYLQIWYINFHMMLLYFSFW